MNDQSLSLQEIEKRGQEIYDQELKDKLEPRYTGKFVAIDIDSKEYFIGDTLENAILKAKGKYSNHLFHSVKIGSTGVFKVSGYYNNERSKWLF